MARVAQSTLALTTQKGNSMKKKIVLFLLAVVMCASCCLVVACDNGMSNDNELSGGVTVTFDFNYLDVENEQQVVQVGQKVVKPQEPTRNGYIFYGWFYNKACTNKYSFDEPVDRAFVLYAGWRTEKANITFDFNDGVTPRRTVTVDALTEVALPSVAQRDGYVFGGWFTDRKGRNEFVAENGVAVDTVVYAYWVETEAKVVYNFNYDNAPNAVVDVVSLGDKIVAPANPSRDRYEFVGWFTDSETTQKYDFDTIVEKQTTILYAGWKLSVAQVTFDLNYDGASEGDVVLVKVGGHATNPQAPERLGYKFDGWFVDKFATKKYDFANTISSDIVLYAAWSKQTYNVTLDVNYTTENTVFAVVDVLFEESVVLPQTVPTRSGYTFVGWYVDQQCLERFVETTAITANMTLYAGWTQGQSKVSVVFRDVDSDTVYSTQSVDVGAKINAPAAPTRENCIWGGWYNDAAWTQPFTNGTIVAEDMIVYAKWLVRYTFEAEYTDLTDKPAQGTSNNGSGPSGLIVDSSRMENEELIGASNGYWVSQLYYTGAELVFEIFAEDDINDAELQLRLTPEYYNMIIAPGVYDVEVNGTKLNYDMLFLAIDGYMWQTDGGTKGNPETNKRPFENYVITTSLKLHKGNNVIKLITSNSNDHGATFNAETPAVDCIYIYSAVRLDWVEGKCHKENIEMI